MRGEVEDLKRYLLYIMTDLTKRERRGRRETMWIELEAKKIKR